MLQLFLGLVGGILARDGSTSGVTGGSSLLQTLQTHQTKELKRIAALPDQGGSGGQKQVSDAEKSTLLHDAVAIQKASLLSPEERKMVDDIIVHVAGDAKLPMTQEQAKKLDDLIERAITQLKTGPTDLPGMTAQVKKLDAQLASREQALAKENVSKVEKGTLQDVHLPPGTQGVVKDNGDGTCTVTRTRTPDEVKQALASDAQAGPLVKQRQALQEKIDGLVGDAISTSEAAATEAAILDTSVAYVEGHRCFPRLEGVVQACDKQTTHLKKDVLPGLEQKHTELSGQIKSREAELRGQLEQKLITEDLPKGAKVPSGPGIVSMTNPDGTTRVTRHMTSEEVQSAIDADPKLAGLKQEQGKVAAQIITCRDQIARLADAKAQGLKNLNEVYGIVRDQNTRLSGIKDVEAKLDVARNRMSQLEGKLANAHTPDDLQAIKGQMAQLQSEMLVGLKALRKLYDENHGSKGSKDMLDTQIQKMEKMIEVTKSPKPLTDDEFKAAFKEIKDTEAKVKTTLTTEFKNGKLAAEERDALLGLGEDIDSVIESNKHFLNTCSRTDQQIQIEIKKAEAEEAAARKQAEAADRDLGPEAKAEQQKNMLDTFSAVGSTVNLKVALKVGVGTENKVLTAKAQVGVEVNVGVKKVLDPHDEHGKFQVYVNLKALAEADASFCGIFDVHGEVKAGVQAALLFDSTAQIKEFTMAMMKGDIAKLKEICNAHKMTSTILEAGASAEVEAGPVKVKLAGGTKTEDFTLADGTTGTSKYTFVEGEVGFKGKELGFEYEHTNVHHSGVTSDEKVFAITLPMEQFKHMVDHTAEHNEEITELAEKWAKMAMKADPALAGIPNAEHLLVASFVKGLGGTHDVGKVVKQLARLAEKGIKDVGIGVVIQNGKFEGIEIFAKGEKKWSISGNVGPALVTGEITGSFKGAVLIPLGGHEGGEHGGEHGNEHGGPEQPGHGPPVHGEEHH